MSSQDQFYIAEAMQYLDSTTVMWDSYAGSTCGSATDIVWIPGSLNGARGVAQCVTWVSLANRICDQAWVQYDVTQIYSESGDYDPDDFVDNFYANLRKTIRHELGHTTGLAHGTPAEDYCDTPPGTDSMVSGWVPTHLMYVSYNTHHLNHINGYY